MHYPSARFCASARANIPPLLLLLLLLLLGLLQYRQCRGCSPAHSDGLACVCLAAKITEVSQVVGSPPLLKVVQARPVTLGHREGRSQLWAMPARKDNRVVVVAAHCAVSLGVNQRQC